MVGRELEVAAAGIVLDFDVPGDGTFHGMADVVNGEGVAVVPTAHVELAERCPVIGPEGLVKEEVAIALVGGHDADAVLKRVEGEGLKDQALPVVRLLLQRRAGWSAGLDGEERRFLGMLRNKQGRGG